MRLRTKKILCIILAFIFVLAFFQTVSFAGDKLKPDDYKDTLTYGDATYIFQKGGSILRIFRNIAAVTALVTITIIGIRYMLGSIDEKAEYKQKMLPVVIGCIFVAGLAGILTLIQSVVA